MCVAIYKPEGVQLHKKVLKKCFRENADGAGFAYLNEDKQAVIEKGFFSFGEFWRAYRDHMKKEAIIHFRWATHGDMSVENCHPFALPEGGALIHNGIIDWAAPKLMTDERSDTRAFTEDLLFGMVANGTDLHDTAFQTLLSEAIGKGNKLVMFYRGKHIIINPLSGGWKHGAWFSNFIWERPTTMITSAGFLPGHSNAGQTWQGKPYSYEHYAYGNRVSEHSLGYGEDTFRPWDEDEEDEKTIDIGNGERVALNHIYARCEICNEWKPETAMVSLGAEKACPACFDEVSCSWDDTEIERTIEKYAG